MEKPKAVSKEQPQEPVKKIVIAAGALIAAFLIGYVPSCVSARNAEEEKARLERRLKLADLRGRIGMASYEANRNNYANAAAFSSEFFNLLAETINTSTDDALKQTLQPLLARRDEITTNLAQADPSVKDKLAQMYAEVFQVTQTQPD
ncbi:MAG TPA: hypothetical protein VFQ92_14845 [Blastocatellia bacterium]|nr:hypothetical protein [Blastocatellia bacterium]